MFTIVVEQNTQIQKMEQDMEALLKEKEQWETITGTTTTGTSRTRTPSKIGSSRNGGCQSTTRTEKHFSVILPH